MTAPGSLHDPGVALDGLPDESDQVHEGRALRAHGVDDRDVALGAGLTLKRARSSTWMGRMR